MGVCDVPVISAVCDVAGEAAASLVSAPFEWLAHAMGSAASWMFEAVWSIFDATTLVDVQRPEYVGVYNLIFGIAVMLMLLFFCLQLLSGLIRRDPTALSRAVLGLARSVVGSFVVIALVGLTLEITDQLCTGIIQAAGETTETMGAKIAALVLGLTGLTIAAPGVGAILIIFLAGLAIGSAAIVWLSLLIRKALLLVAVVLAPLAFSGSSWDAAKGWIGKWAMFVLALILSKLVLVVIFLVSITQVSAPISMDLTSVSDPLAGIVLMALAGFAPYMTYRFLSFVGVDLYNQIGAEQDAKNAINRPVPVPTPPTGDGPAKVFGSPKSTAPPGESSAPSGGSSTPSSTTAASSSAPASTSAPASSTAASGGAAAGGGGAAAGAGPAAAVIVGAEVAKRAATAGPEMGQALAGRAEHAADAASQPGTTTQGGAPPVHSPAAPTSVSDPPPPPPPVPRTPSDPSAKEF
jgi:hypothetical protein